MIRQALLFSTFAGMLLGMGTAPARAQEFCAERAEMVKSLADQFKESPAALGQIDGSAVIEVFVSDSGSWTILATRTDGKSCVVSAGEGWELNVAALGAGA